MNIRRAGRKVVKNLHKEYGIYRIGFVNERANPPAMLGRIV